jgi:hypothetical protein
MQNIPDDYNLEDLKNNLMKAVPEILDIHEVFYKSTIYVQQQQDRFDANCLY